MSRSEIPEELKQAAIDIAIACERHGLRFCDVTLRPSHESEFHDKVSFSWMHNSHGPVPRTLRVRYEKWDTVDVPETMEVKHGDM